MNRRWTLGFALIGASLLTLQVHRFGLGQLWADATTAGWILVPIVLLYGVVHACDAEAWRAILAEETSRPGWGRLYTMVIAGSALNFLTPVVNLGGEPFKLGVLADTLGTSRAAGAVVIRNLVRALGLLAFWLAAVIVGWFLLPSRPAFRIPLAIAALGVIIVTGFLLRAQRRAGLARWFDRLARWPWIGRPFNRLRHLRPRLEQMDAQISGFSRDHPRALALAVGFEFLGRAIYVLEFCLIGLALGIPIGYLAALSIGGLETLVGNLLFFVPYEVGTRETSTVLLFTWLGYPPEAGLFTALVGRLRDLIWIGVGITLTGLAPGRRRADFPADPTAAP